MRHTRRNPMGCLYAILAGIAATIATFFVGYALAILLVTVTHDEVYGNVGWVFALVACPVVVIFAMAYAVRIPRCRAERKAREEEHARGFPVIVPPADSEESE